MNVTTLLSLSSGTQITPSGVLRRRHQPPLLKRTIEYFNDYQSDNDPGQALFIGGRNSQRTGFWPFYRDDKPMFSLAFDRYRVDRVHTPSKMASKYFDAFALAPRYLIDAWDDGANHRQ
jgi:hypothetical protein